MNIDLLVLFFSATILMNLDVDDEDMDRRNAVDEVKEDASRRSLPSAKTKRAGKISDDDDETSYEDSVPRSTIKTRYRSKHTTTLTKSESENEQEEESRCASNQTIRLDAHSSSDEEDNDGPEEGPASELDSLDGFIVYSHDEDEHEPNDADDFKAILEQNGRQNISNVKWDFAADMLADSGKNPELCMRAVCALYRQQTEDEKAFKVTKYRNGRGFSQLDAFRGCELAEFLTEGDPAVDLNKTVEELKKHNSEWIELCMALATNYYRQLFQIYKNKEDPYFLPE